MDNNDENMPIDEECKMNSEQNKTKTNSEPPIKDDENKEIRAIKQKEICSGLLIYRTREQDVTTTQPRAAKQTILKEIIINPTIKCKELRQGLKMMDLKKQKIVLEAIQDCKHKEEALKHLQYYCYGIFDCMLFSYFAMHGFFCCPSFPVHVPCPLIL